MLFSIIIPAFNAETYLSCTIQSILDQNFQQNEFEIIVVDDCSTDSTCAIVESLQTIAPNITLIKHYHNKRQGGARNTGIDTAKGEWIIFVDADDVWLGNDVLSVFQSLIQAYPDADIVRSISYTSMAVNGEQRAKQSFDNNLISNRILSGKQYVASKTFFYNLWTSCYRKRLISEHSLKFRENVVFEDSDWATITCFMASKVALFDYPFYGYRTNPESVTNKHSLYSFADNVTSAFVLQDAIVKYKMGNEQKNAINDRIKKSIKTFVKLTRHYNRSDSLLMLRRLKKTDVLSSKKYNLSYSERVIFWALRHWQFGLVTSVKTAYSIKNLIRNLI